MDTFSRSLYQTLRLTVYLEGRWSFAVGFIYIYSCKNQIKGSGRHFPLYNWKNL